MSRIEVVILFGVASVVTVLLVGSMILIGMDQDQFDAKCHARGGIPGNRQTCLKPGSQIDMN